MSNYFNGTVGEYRGKALNQGRFEYESKLEFFREINEVIEDNLSWREKYTERQREAEEETISRLNRCGLKTRREDNVQYDGYDLLRMAILEEAIRDQDEVFIRSERFAKWYPSLNPEYLLRLIQKKGRKKHEKFQTVKCFGD